MMHYRLHIKNRLQILLDILCNVEIQKRTLFPQAKKEKEDYI